MKVFLTELNDRETEFDFTQEEKWVQSAVARVDERAEGLIPGARAKSKTSSSLASREVRGHVELRKVDEVIVVTGNVETYIQLICSRCATPFRLETQPSFSALFCKDPVMAGVAHLYRENPKKSAAKKSDDREIVARPMGQNKGFARHAHDDSAEGACGSTDQDLDITYLSEDFIDLGDVLTEQLQLQVPFQPLCSEECKGICSNCGADMNVGRCACEKLAKATPFSVLRDFKVHS